MSFSVLASERSLMVSQIGLRLVDEFTGAAALQAVEASLALRTGAGAWQPLPIQPVLAPSGTLLYPGLGRSAHVAVAPVVRYRVTLQSSFYRPDYLRTQDALEFDIHPYDNEHAPVLAPNLPQTVLLLPSAQYPHAPFMRTLRGITVDSGGAPIPNVEITQGVAERVLSDERGVFVLPLRWVAPSGNVVFDAHDHRSGRTDQLTLTLPHDLRQSQTFTLT
ncbi:MAG: carboxypeptidase-like regulatory domain-containing protein [Gammaproteobacteria bacterium]